MTLSEPMRNFFEEYTEAIVIIDDKNETTYVNKAFVHLTGYTLEEFKVFSVPALFQVKVNFTTISLDKNYRWECGLKCKDGTDLWMRVSISPFHFDDKHVGKIYHLSANPTQEQLKNLLKENETRFTILADATPVMIWMTDESNLTYYFNQTWLEFTGRKLEDEIGTGWFKNVHPDDRFVFSEIKKLLTDNINYSCEYRLKRHDGVYRHILEIGTPRFLADGSFGGYMGSCLDITEMKTAQIELANQTKELQRSNEELEQFAYVASHDLQEPLRMVNSYVQLVKKRVEAKRTDGIEEFMEYAVDGVNRMQGLINDLLQYSRVNRKGNPFATVDMNEVLKIVMAHLANKVAENKAQVELSDLPILQGDSFQLIRLFQNLIENALKFKAEGVIPVIKIAVEEKGDFWQFSIKDNGIGIDQKFYNRIFVIFQRLHARTDYEGTGIGLAVCKKIVERHGGEIWIESETGKGSTFYFTIKK